MWLLLTCAIGGLFATGLSPLAHAIPWSWEKKLGAVIQPEHKAYPGSPQARALLQRLVGRLYPLEPGDKNFSIEVRVVKNPVVNAYAGLGGKITIDSGLLKQAQSPEELAGVLAHEIEHVRHRHILQKFLEQLFTVESLQWMLGGGWTTNLAKYFLNIDFTRSQEAQADEDGLKRLQKAHINNRGFRQFFERMELKNPSSAFLSDHPSNRARIEMVERFKNVDVRPIMTPAEWAVLKNYCGGRP
ncbi:MAG: M48 family metallopeptidase [bacterium]